MVTTTEDEESEESEEEEEEEVQNYVVNPGLYKKEYNRRLHTKKKAWKVAAWKIAYGEIKGITGKVRN